MESLTRKRGPFNVTAGCSRQTPPQDQCAARPHQQCETRQGTHQDGAVTTGVLVLGKVVSGSPRQTESPVIFRTNAMQAPHPISVALGWGFLCGAVRPGSWRREFCSYDMAPASQLLYLGVWGGVGVGAALSVSPPS